MIKDAGSKFDDYSISLIIRQILLHCGYELTEKYFFIDSANECIKWVNTGLTEMKSCKKQKKTILEKKPLSII